MKNKISKKAERLIDDFSNNVEQLAYSYSGDNIRLDPEKIEIRKDKSYSKLITYIANLENKLKDYRKATIKEN